jgi:LPXTG-motif cell wall-anchored protein
MKRHILLPVVLLVYLAFMAYFFYPGKNSESHTQYYLTIGITLIVIGLLAYFLKKKEGKK